MKTFLDITGRKTFWTPTSSQQSEFQLNTRTVSKFSFQLAVNIGVPIERPSDQSGEIIAVYSKKNRKYVNTMWVQCRNSYVRAGDPYSNHCAIRVNANTISNTRVSGHCGIWSSSDSWETSSIH